ncbi:hypothetical protein MMC22_004642 [Lobaria immixta]|nr:hypothetical protein [Lobaria immixta]
MSCDKLIFWPGHCQHPDARIALPAEVNTPAKPRAANSTTSAATPAELQRVRTEPKRVKPIEIPQPISSTRPVYRGVSKLAASEEEKYVVPAKRILKPATSPKPKTEPIDEAKSLDLAFIGAAPFQYLAKQKNVEIFANSMRDIEDEENAISMKDIEYQLNKIAKTPPDSKTVVPEEYHEFLDVFSKRPRIPYHPIRNMTTRYACWKDIETTVTALSARCQHRNLNS